MLQQRAAYGPARIPFAAHRSNMHHPPHRFVRAIEAGNPITFTLTLLHRQFTQHGLAARGSLELTFSSRYQGDIAERPARVRCRTCRCPVVQSYWLRCGLDMPAHHPHNHFTCSVVRAVGLGCGKDMSNYESETLISSTRRSSGT
jgi:hypothetical protein